MSWGVAFTIWKSITAAIAIGHKDAKAQRFAKSNRTKSMAQEVVMNGRE